MAKSDVLIKMKADVSNYDANIAKARKQLEGFKKDNLSVGGVMKQVSGSMVSMAAQYASVAAAIGGIGMAFRDNIETARNFEKSMSQLSSLTGMVGKDLEKLKGYAIELGASTTLSASQVADAFKMIGSQQPQLLESGEALKSVTKNAITLAEAAGIELSEAAQTLSVSINQMGGDSSNAERYINVLAAAAQKGAGDIVWLGEAITKSGTTAKAVGTDYEELVANLEQLAKAGYDASTAGTALRSIIMNLEKQANNNYKPSVVGLTQAFKNLGDAHLSIVQYQEIAGKMFAAQAKALADAAGEAENMRIAITGTNTAEEQAKTNTDNLDGSLKALASAWEGLNLHINSSNGLLRDCVDTLHDVIVWIDKALPKLNEYWNKSKWMLNPTKAGAQDSMVQHLGNKYGWEDDAEAKRAQQKKQREEKSKQLRKYAYEHGITYNGRYITKAEYEAEFGSQNKGGDSGGGGSTNKTKKTKSDITSHVAFDNNKALLSAEKGIDNMPSVWKIIIEQSENQGLGDQGLRDMMDIGKEQFDLGRLLKEYVDDPDKHKRKNQGDDVTGLETFSKQFSQITGAVDGIFSGIEALGVELPEGLKSILGGIQTVAGILTAISSLVTIITAIQGTKAVPVIGTFLAQGGVVKAASGTVVGNTYSNDQIPTMLNAGEVVLNKAQAGALASALQGGGLAGLQLEAVVRGEQLKFVLNTNGRRTGKGEFVTSNFR